jgi:hypothetical protein
VLHISLVGELPSGADKLLDIGDMSRFKLRVELWQRSVRGLQNMGFFG